MSTLHKALEPTGKAQLTIDGKTALIEKGKDDNYLPYWKHYEGGRWLGTFTSLQDVAQSLYIAGFKADVHSWQFVIEWQEQDVTILCFKEHHPILENCTTIQVKAMVAQNIGLAYIYRSLVFGHDYGLIHVPSQRWILKEGVPTEIDAQEAIRRLVLLPVDWNKQEVPEKVGKRLLGEVVREEVEKSIGWLAI